MTDSKINEGVSINNGDTKTYRDYDKDLPDENVGGSVKLEEYIRPFELAGSLSLPIQVLTIIAAFFMFAVTALTTIDVTGRYIFNSPVDGGVELIEFMLGLLIFSALTIASTDLLKNSVSRCVERYSANSSFSTGSIAFLFLLLEVVSSSFI